MMSQLGKKLKHPIRELYFSTSLKVARLLIHGHGGARGYNRVAIVAAMGGRNGITHGAALQADAIRSFGSQVQLIDASSAMGKPFNRIPHEAADTYIFHSGGPETSNLVLAALPHAAKGYRIAYWAWELPLPPKRWPNVEGVYSEIWTPSEFSRESLSKRYRSVPIHVVPHRICPQKPRQRDYEVPFTVLAMGDSRSSFTRKNVSGAVAAFKAAFGETASARLIIKVNGKAGQAGNVPTDWRQSPNISVADGYLNDQEIDELYESADVFLSLHRAEGFGLPMMEAMSRGIPVVATGYSGNLQFMDASNSILVPYKLVPVHDEFTYSDYSDAVWAEPSIDAAAESLKKLKGNTEYYNNLAISAHQSVEAFAADWKLPDGDAMIQSRSRIERSGNLSAVSQGYLSGSPVRIS